MEKKTSHENKKVTHASASTKKAHQEKEHVASHAVQKQVDPADNHLLEQSDNTQEPANDGPLDEADAQHVANQEADEDPSMEIQGRKKKMPLVGDKVKIQGYGDEVKEGRVLRVYSDEMVDVDYTTKENSVQTIKGLNRQMKDKTAKGWNY